MDRAGSLDRLRLSHEELSGPGPGEVQVAVEAVGLNFADIFAIVGMYSATPEGSFVPGLEYAGRIAAVGTTQTGPRKRVHGAQRATPRWKVGDRVMGVTRFGAYASHLNVDARYVYALPRKWTAAEGAALVAQSLTAWYAIKTLGGTRAGASVLVQSAAGGVGLQALWMLERLRCRVVAVVGRSGKIPLLRERARLQPEQIVVRNQGAFSTDLDAALAYLGQDGFDLILDSVAGPYFRPAFARLRPAGRLVLFGAADFMPTGRRPNYLRLAYQYLLRPRVDPVAMISDNRSVMAFNLIWLWDRVDELNGLLDEILALGPAAPYVGHTAPFLEAPAALRHFQSGATTGKVVLLTGT